jgi:flavin reductase (DIM6/NTAB) family NADH-FMN oxidoreductase RutF
MTCVTTTQVSLQPQDLKRVFAAFPSGVTVLAAHLEGTPVGLTASSFTSVSLDPPLVSVAVATESRTWPLLRRAARIGVSVLADAHEDASRQLSMREGDRFAGLPWRQSRDDALFLGGAAAWFDCSIYREVEAGDHHIVLLEIHDLDVDHAVAPLVYHGSRYRRLAP